MKFLVMPNTKEDLEELKESNIKGIILSIKDLAICSNVYFEVSELEDIINKFRGKEVNVCLNKIMHNSDLEYLEMVLTKLNNMDISKIIFYDMAVLKIAKDLEITKELVLYQEHLNASIYSHNFYKKRGINYSFITNDITFDEVLEIKRKTNMKIMYQVYGYIPMFYSRRYLLTNYFKYINKTKEDDLYYIELDDNYYPIKEEDTGTGIYTKKINLLDNSNLLEEVDYLIINGFNLNIEEIIDVINNKIEKDNNYHGFYNKKTIYKLKEGDY